MIEVFDILVIVVVGGAIGLGHYFPWHIIDSLVDKNELLHRSFAYAYGTGCILAGLVAYAVYHRTWNAIPFYVLLILSTGLSTLLPRGMTWLAEYKALEADRHDLEATVGLTNPSTSRRGELVEPSGHRQYDDKTSLEGLFSCQEPKKRYHG